LSSLRVTIGGITLRISASGELPAGFIAERMTHFLEPEDTSTIPSIDLTYINEDPSGLPLGPLLYDPGSIWRLHRSATSDGYAAVISYSDGGALTSRACLLEVDSYWTRCRMTELAHAARWSSLLNLGAGEILVRTRIIHEQGIVFHATAIDDGGRGILMVGHSGAGKSTQSLTWQKQPDTVVLSDDRIAVRLESAGARAYGSPWGGTADIVSAASVNLNAILILEQAPDNALIPMDALNAISMLAVRSFMPYWSPELVETALDTLQTLVATVPVYLFRCRPDDSVIPVVRSIL